MALIKCPECGQDTSSKAKNCPNCRYVFENILYEIVDITDDEVKGFAKKIINSFEAYKIYLFAEQCFTGRNFTKYCFSPEKGTRIKSILSCKEDISFTLGTVIDINTNYKSGFIEIELPNKIIKEIVHREDNKNKENSTNIL